MRRPDAALLRTAATSGGVVAVAMLGACTLAAGAAGFAGAAAGALLVFLFAGTGFLVIRLTASLDPAVVLIAVLAAYVVKLLAVGVLLAVFLPGPDALDRTAFGLTVVVVTLAWTAGAVAGFARARTPVYDPVPTPPATVLPDAVPTTPGEAR